MQEGECRPQPAALPEQDSAEHQDPGSRRGGTTMLLCGADMLESFIKPGVWFPEHVEEILGKHCLHCQVGFLLDAVAACGVCSLLTAHTELSIVWCPGLFIAWEQKLGRPELDTFSSNVRLSASGSGAPQQASAARQEFAWGTNAKRQSDVFVLDAC